MKKRSAGAGWVRANDVAALALLLCVTATIAGCAEAPHERGTRVVLITLDTMRFDTLEGTTSGTKPMPLLQDWARRGLVLERHYAASSTTQPTHASLLTGLHPWEHGVSRNGQVLSNDYETLAERFAAHGYRTGAVVSSFPLHRSFGFEQGFERFDDAFEIQMTLEWSGAAVPGGAFYSLADAITDKAIAMVDALAAPRQFFWFHYFDLHEPYGDAAASETPVDLAQIYALIEAGDPAARAQLETARQKYEADARNLDLRLDRLLRHLTRDADTVDSHILLVSDHGESFGEDGSIGHGKRVSDSLIRVPCVLISPAVSQTRSPVPVGSVDVPATLLALAGLPALASTGRDMTRPLPPERSVFGMRRTFAGPFRELRLDGKRHLLPDHEFFVADAQGVTTGDASQVRSRSAPAAADAPPVVVERGASADERARALFAAFASDLARAGAATNLDERSRAALEALGYIQ